MNSTNIRFRSLSIIYLHMYTFIHRIAQLTHDQFSCREDFVDTCATHWNSLLENLSMLCVRHTIQNASHIISCCLEQLCERFSTYFPHSTYCTLWYHCIMVITAVVSRGAWKPMVRTNDRAWSTQPVTIDQSCFSYVDSTFNLQSVGIRVSLGVSEAAL